MTCENRFAGRKVLLLATVYSHLAAFHIPYIELLQQLGCEVHAAASSVEGGRENVEKTGAICWEIPFRRSPYSLQNVRACIELRRPLLENHYDLIHVHTPVASFLGRLLARATDQGKTLYTVHGFHFYKGSPLRNWLVYYTAERLASRGTDGLIVMNTEDLESAERMGFELGKNLFYVHGVGVDLNTYSRSSTLDHSIRDELGIHSDDIVVTCVAELNRNKNQGYLLDAWKHLSGKVANAYLLLVGGGDVRSLQKKVEREQIKRVHFLGYRRDVPNILQETDIAVLVSKREGLPRYVMEAMAAGKPVVATDIRGNRDLVDHGETGFLVKLGDVSGLVSALERLAVDRDLGHAMGSKGREKIRDYSLDRVEAEMVQIYLRYLPNTVGRVGGSS